MSKKKQDQATESKAKAMDFNEKFSGYLCRNARVLSILSNSEVKIFDRKVKALIKECRKGDRPLECHQYGLFRKTWCK